MKDGVQSKQHLRQKYLQYVTGKEKEQMKGHTEIRGQSDGEDELVVLFIIRCSLQSHKRFTANMT